MRILHVITSLRRDAGGPARSVQGLVAAECAAGLDAWVWAMNGGSPWVDGVRLWEPGGDLKAFDIVHIHGLWSMQLHRVVSACRKTGIPYIIAPRGMLEPWSLQQKWLKKRVARFLYQDADLKYAAALHATAESEAEQFRRLGFKNYCIVSPNGVNVPARRIDDVGRGERRERRALFVSRMHAKKGVLELVESWARIKPQDWVCELVYTLNGKEETQYEAKVKAKVKALGLEDRFLFTGPLDDERKWEAYARADLFVLPTHSENFGIVVAEALWAGVPVITTKGTPWNDLETSHCGWWIELPPKDSLDAALLQAVDSRELRKMGEAGHRLVQERYTWNAVCQSVIHGYEQVLNTCELAPCDLCQNYGDTCPMK